jgi:general secretion pathway protein G
MSCAVGKRGAGFTVIELLVVLAAIGLLLGIAAPRYFQHLDTAREVTLKQDLQQLRDAIDKFYADQTRYPASLDELVQRRYLRAVPIDPITQRKDTWIVVAPDASAVQAQGAVFDVRSGAKGQGIDGTPYDTW